MKRLILAVATVGALALGAVATAQPAPQGDGRLSYPEMRARAHERFARMDVDRNGRVDRAERADARTERRQARASRREAGGAVLTREAFLRRAEMRFARLDVDRDGRLTRDERQARRERLGRAGDARRGGRELTLASLDERLRRRFDRMDRDDDGFVTRDERREARRGRALR